MPKRTSASIAKKARAKAEADFATWLMMAKLGSFDDLPADAQAWLMSYRTHLEKMPESEATQTAIREVYRAYYAQMGGAGEAPEPAREPRPAEGAVVDLKNVRTAKLAASAPSPGGRSKRPVSPFLIFVGMVAALVALKFAFGF
ncbi:hypothetical protein [Bradyrhizobium sp. LHD-71]|uniref:hypothetical protein n=1 Tax=Bradyrhizobium sp. LHD-71 TaxID=3072141 RepID=UPI00280D4580|nr:hypothetical protein [Bradyrhizobium sp. LHD-71]MDQ8729737.1 hypothetical protein [Bradyrhizobium sp. LHD-71]